MKFVLARQYFRQSQQLTYCKGYALFVTAYYSRTSIDLHLCRLVNINPLLLTLVLLSTFHMHRFCSSRSHELNEAWKFRFILLKLGKGLEHVPSAIRMA